MKKLFIPILFLATTLLCGCITKDYNLRAIKEDRNLSSVDSTNYRVSFDDTTWVADNISEWASASVIITTIDNTISGEQNARWLKRVVTQGFKGQILIEWDMDYLPDTWGSNPIGTFKRDYYNSTIDHSATALVTTVGTSTPATFLIDDEQILLLNPSDTTGWVFDGGTVFASYTDSLLTWINGDRTDIKIGLLTTYAQSTWIPYRDYPSEIIASDADPLTKGYNIESYTSNDLIEFNAYANNMVYDLRTAKVDVFICGDLLDSDITKLTDRSIKGVFFEDVSPTNITSTLEKVSTYRTAYAPINTQDSLLLIAGITKDVYHEITATSYANMVNQCIQNGVYFTPGADNKYFDYPDFQAGDWWIRTDDDSNWQTNPNNPIYVDYTSHPRKLFGVAVSSIATQHAMTFPLGGHTWSSAIGHNNQYWILGGDVSGIYASIDGGITFNNHNRGIANDIDPIPYFGRDVIAVKNSYFEGFILANDRGIYKLATPFTTTDPWIQMTDSTDNTHYTTYVAKTWGQAWMTSIPFGALDWDGNNLLCAVAGSPRYNSITAQLNAYPWNVADGDSLTIGGGDEIPASWTGGDYSDNIWGKVGLWKYDYTTPNAGWHPIEGAESYKQEWGFLRDIEVAIVGSDTLYVVATSDGPKLLTVNGASKVWTEISDDVFWNANEDEIEQPNWNTEAKSTTKYTYAGSDGTDDSHITVIQQINSALPATGTITLNGVNYDYTSYSERTFDITGTLSTTVPKGYTVTEQTDTQANWDNWMNDNGDIYCVITNENNSWGGDSGLYRRYFGSNWWNWVGDNEATICSTEGFPGVSTPNLLTVSDVGVGRWTSNPMYPEFAIGSYANETFDDKFSNINGVSGALVDTLYLGGHNALNILRGVISHESNGARNMEWIGIITRDYTLDPPDAQPQPDLKRHGGWPSNWAMSLIHKMTIDPNDSKHIWTTAGDYSFWSVDAGKSWTTNNNIGYNDTGGFIGTGQDETCVNGIAILHDGRMIITHSDGYPTISNDDTWTYQQRFTPEGLDAYENCIDKNTITPWASESGAILTFQGWQGDTSTDDYILLMNGNVTNITTAGKWYIIHDDNGDGDFFDVDEWENICSTLPNANLYTYLGNVVTNGIDKFWTPFTKYMAPICDGASEVDSQGVMEFYLNEGTWEFNIIDQPGLDTMGDCRPRDIAYDSVSNRIWVGSPFEGNGGGVYIIDLDDATPTWLAVFGEGAISPYDSWEIYGAVTSLEVSEDGTHIYWGGTGESGKMGGIWRITNGQADTDSFIIEWVVNNTGLLYIPKYTYEPIPDFYANRGSQWNTNEQLSNRKINCSEILIDKLDNNKIFFISGISNSIDTNKGLYALDITNQEYVRLFENDERSWLTSARVGNMLIYTDVTTPSRIAWGTHCVGVSYMDYDDLFPTGNYGEGEPPIEMMGASINQPIFNPENIAAIIGDTIPVPTAVEGAPIINSISGSILDGNFVTIIGESFGTIMGSVTLGDSKFYENIVSQSESTTYSWSDELLVIGINQGNFVNENTVYLFVIGADGKVSLPYELKIGQ